MSYYYCYYLGIKDKFSGLVKPLGPFDCNNNFKPIIERSRSFASNLHEDFKILSNDMISQELREKFEYEDWQGNKQIEIKFLPFSDLTKDSYIIKGYFPIDDIQAWEQGGDDSLFYSVINAHAYNELMKKELIFGKNQPEKDEEGYSFTKLNASDYAYDAIPNYYSKEYEAELIRQVASILFDYELSEKYELVILETEG